MPVGFIYCCVFLGLLYLKLVVLDISDAKKKKTEDFCTIFSYRVVFGVTLKNTVFISFR